VAAVVFTVGASAVILDRNVQSVRPVLSELSGLDSSAARKLRDSGIRTPEHLERAVRREGPGAVAFRAGVPREAVERAALEASLALHKGMGAPAAHLLEAAGIRKVSELASADPEELTARLSRVAASRRETAPRPEYVRVWVRAARLDGRPRR
jgi:predicted RecB family nuclease